MTLALERGSFDAMGTNCAVAVVAAPGDHLLARLALAAAQHEVEACERALSRFEGDSDLTRLNRAAGTWIRVDQRLADALIVALDARVNTGGRFDPTILPALEAAGYDRSFELLSERVAAPLAGRYAGARVDVDPDAAMVRVERDAAVDLGGIGKGFAATRALQAMRAAWPALGGGLVDLGGDVAVWGTPPEGGPWRVDVADQRKAGGVLLTLELRGGGVATSGRNTRRFGPGRRLHHLIDPATGRPAGEGPLSVTVVAPSAIEAEAYATALAIASVDDARAELAARPELAALYVPQVGEHVPIGRLPVARGRPLGRVVISTQKTGRSPWH